MPSYCVGSSANVKLVACVASSERGADGGHCEAVDDGGGLPHSLGTSASSAGYPGADEAAPNSLETGRSSTICRMRGPNALTATGRIGQLGPPSPQHLPFSQQSTAKSACGAALNAVSLVFPRITTAKSCAGTSQNRAP